jgi:hypothetical protein
MGYLVEKKREPALGRDQLLMLGLQPGALLVKVGDQGVDGVLPLECEPGEVLPVRPDGLACLTLQGLPV